MEALKQSVKELGYFLVAIDPIHVGTGGYRLGSVDNTILREPHTKVPKIPGSSISGVVKSFYPYLSGSLEEWECITSDGGCGKENCMICFTFGYSTNGESQKGKAQFFDANIIMFPIFTTIGTRWITTPEILNNIFGFEIEEPSYEKAFISKKPKKDLNFIAVGWLSLNLEEKPNLDSLKEKSSSKEFQSILDNLVIVNSGIFPFLVNANLEVRTSTAIDPKTGTVKEGALFTYEAIPRGTVFSTEVGFFDYTIFKSHHKSEEAVKRLKDAINLLAVIGLGGMNTRGFGRVKPIER